MNASKMMARMTMTIQKKNTMMPGMECPAMDLALAMAASYPLLSDLFASLAGFALAGESGGGPLTLAAAHRLAGRVSVVGLIATGGPGAGGIPWKLLCNILAGPGFWRVMCDQ
jgi:pimeloyl-ACP methyl ester carboxylesterase